VNDVLSATVNDADSGGEMADCGTTKLRLHQIREKTWAQRGFVHIRHADAGIVTHRQNRS
jgi:hypothetical protein